MAAAGSTAHADYYRYFFFGGDHAHYEAHHVPGPDEPSLPEIRALMGTHAAWRIRPGETPDAVEARWHQEYLNLVAYAPAPAQAHPQTLAGHGIYDIGGAAETQPGLKYGVGGKTYRQLRLYMHGVLTSADHTGALLGHAMNLRLHALDFIWHVAPERYDADQQAFERDVAGLPRWATDEPALHAAVVAQLHTYLTRLYDLFYAPPSPGAPMQPRQAQLDTHDTLLALVKEPERQGRRGDTLADRYAWWVGAMAARRPVPQVPHEGVAAVQEPEEPPSSSPELVSSEEPGAVPMLLSPAQPPAQPPAPPPPAVSGPEPMERSPSTTPSDVPGPAPRVRSERPEPVAKRTKVHGGPGGPGGGPGGPGGGAGVDDPRAHVLYGTHIPIDLFRILMNNSLIPLQECNRLFYLYAWDLVLLRDQQVFTARFTLQTVAQREAWACGFYSRVPYSFLPHDVVPIAQVDVQSDGPNPWNPVFDMDPATYTTNYLLYLTQALLMLASRGWLVDLMQWTQAPILERIAADFFLLLEEGRPANTERELWDPFTHASPGHAPQPTDRAQMVTLPRTTGHATVLHPVAALARILAPAVGVGAMKEPFDVLLVGPGVQDRAALGDTLMDYILRRATPRKRMEWMAYLPDDDLREGSRAMARAQGLVDGAEAAELIRLANLDGHAFAIEYGFADPRETIRAHLHAEAVTPNAPAGMSTPFEPRFYARITAAHRLARFLAAVRLHDTPARNRFTTDPKAESTAEQYLLYMNPRRQDHYHRSATDNMSIRDYFYFTKYLDRAHFNHGAVPLPDQMQPSAVQGAALSNSPDAKLREAVRRAVGLDEEPDRVGEDAPDEDHAFHAEYAAFRQAQGPDPASVPDDYRVRLHTMFDAVCTTYARQHVGVCHPDTAGDAFDFHGVPGGRHRWLTDRNTGLWNTHAGMCIRLQQLLVSGLLRAQGLPADADVCTPMQPLVDGQRLDHEDLDARVVDFLRGPHGDYPAMHGSLPFVKALGLMQKTKKARSAAVEYGRDDEHYRGFIPRTFMPPHVPLRTGPGETNYTTSLLAILQYDPPFIGDDKVQGEKAYMGSFSTWRRDDALPTILMEMWAAYSLMNHTLHESGRSAAVTYRMGHYVGNSQPYLFPLVSTQTPLVAEGPNLYVLPHARDTPRPGLTNATFIMTRRTHIELIGADMALPMWLNARAVPGITDALDADRKPLFARVQAERGEQGKGRKTTDEHYLIRYTQYLCDALLRLQHSEPIPPVADVDQKINDVLQESAHHVTQWLRREPSLWEWQTRWALIVQHVGNRDLRSFFYAGAFNIMLGAIPTEGYIEYPSYPSEKERKQRTQQRTGRDVPTKQRERDRPTLHTLHGLSPLALSAYYMLPYRGLPSVTTFRAIRYQDYVECLYLRSMKGLTPDINTHADPTAQHPFTFVPGREASRSQPLLKVQMLAPIAPVQAPAGFIGRANRWTLGQTGPDPYRYIDVATAWPLFAIQNANAPETWQFVLSDVGIAPRIHVAPSSILREDALIFAYTNRHLYLQSLVIPSQPIYDDGREVVPPEDRPLHATYYGAGPSQGAQLEMVLAVTQRVRFMGSSQGVHYWRRRAPDPSEENSFFFFPAAFTPGTMTVGKATSKGIKKKLQESAETLDTPFPPQRVSGDSIEATFQAALTRRIPADPQWVRVREAFYANLSETAANKETPMSPVSVVPAQFPRREDRFERMQLRPGPTTPSHVSTQWNYLWFYAYDDYWAVWQPQAGLMVRVDLARLRLYLDTETAHPGFLQAKGIPTVADLQFYGDRAQQFMQYWYYLYNFADYEAEVALIA